MKEMNKILTGTKGKIKFKVRADQETTFVVEQDNQDKLYYLGEYPTNQIGERRMDPIAPISYFIDDLQGMKALTLFLEKTLSNIKEKINEKEHEERLKIFNITKKRKIRRIIK
jgi:hypothetical protein